jgi:nitroreductase
MMKRSFAFLFSLLLVSAVHAQDIELPAPHKTGGLPLMETLAKRSTSRSFDARDLTPQQLSDLLWAGFGINRPDGKRTAPSAHNRQELELYVLLKQGAYIYDAAKNTLQQTSTEDLRSLGAKTEAAVCILFVADLSKRQEKPEAGKELATVDSGFIGQNLYLYCASEGLATGYRAGGFDSATLKPKLKLKPDQEIVAAQPVGFPKS